VGRIFCRCCVPTPGSMPATWLCSGCAAIRVVARPILPTSPRPPTNSHGDLTMSLHVFANFVTPFGTAANNRAETEGNITTLQKILWQHETRSTVSAEAIRFALRRRLDSAEKNGTNRRWDEDERNNIWKDWTFKGWGSDKGSTFIDDDLLGFMTAEA